uniref:Uncharacterized protein n=1 Tax=Pyramimonas obovata TaxID=1411642 RepID=A0A7S0QY57_9CHLO|mmetsp:Transcript_17206/g.37417  ORF Transcript_17206/g.37417 Transcript_17206/m.37417 type:complete len:422 (+) Transcript_17206:259-1524(+)
MIHFGASHVVNSITVAFAALFVCANVLGAIYTVRTLRLSRPFPVVHSFSLLWGTRLMLYCTASVWVLSSLLRLPLLWEISWLPSISEERQRTLCHLQPILAQGISQPWCLLLAVYSIRLVFSHSSDKEKPPFVLAWAWEAIERNLTGMSRLDSTGSAEEDFVVAAQPNKLWDRFKNLTVIGQSLVTALPLTLVLALLLRDTTVSPMHSSVNDLSRSFTETAHRGDPEECAGISTPCTLCTCPLLSVIVSIVFTVGYCIVSYFIMCQARRLVVNYNQLRRILTLQGLTACTVMVSTILRGVSAAMPVGGWGYWVLVTADIYLAALAAGAVTFVLGLKPTYDASMALHYQMPPTVLAMDIENQDAKELILMKDNALYERDDNTSSVSERNGVYGRGLVVAAAEPAKFEALTSTSSSDALAAQT